MKSVKNYSKKKPRVQAKVQPRVQARSNKKQINKKVSRKVNKNISRGTKKVKRNKNKKLTKKNLKSRVNVSEGGGILKSLRNRFKKKKAKKSTEPPVDLTTTMNGELEVPEVQNPLLSVHTIFFDVDGTLGDTGCGGGTPDDGDNYNKKELLRLLDTLKEKGVRLFILTRCESGGNICKTSQKEYYKPIVERMDGVFAADVLEIDVNDPLPGEDGNMIWAAIKTMVMEEYCKSKNILEEQKASVVLIDDDHRNARLANKYGFRAFHNKKPRNVSGAALRMTNGALEKILNELDVRSQSGSRYKPQEDFFDVSEESEDDRKVYEYSELSRTERKGKLVDLTRELNEDIKGKIKEGIEKSRKVRCSIRENGEDTLVTDYEFYEKTFDDNFVVVDISSYTETGAETVNLEFIKFLGSDIYSSDNRFDFSETELGPNEIIIHWSDKLKCLVVYFGLNNILDKKKKYGVGFPIGRVFSRTERPSDLFNLSDEEIRQFKTRVVLMFDKKKLQDDLKVLEKTLTLDDLPPKEKILSQIKIKKMLANINDANQKQSKIIIKIKRRQNSGSTEVFEGFENNHNTEFAGFAGFEPNTNKSGPKVLANPEPTFVDPRTLLTSVKNGTEA